VVRPADPDRGRKKDKLTAIDIQTGKAAWATAVPTENEFSRIRVADDLLLAGEPGGRPLSLAHGPWNMTVLEAATGKILWSKSLRTEVVMHKDIMIFTIADQVVGANRRDGTSRWSIPCNTSGYSSCDPLIADGTLYLFIDGSGDNAGGGVFAIPLEDNPALAGPKL
jgi:outer membrane protein assembly factor BamB